jgi:16S rRNA (uracil1498-N3)-methyltransferase
MEVTGPDAHHLMHVLRARAGQHLLVVDPAGAACEAEMTAFAADKVMLQRIQDIAADTESPIELILAQCLPKSDKMDFIVQKATELGATGIQPLRSHNCVVKYDAKKCAQRQKKWQRTVNEAAKQCGRSLLPTVEPIRDLAEWLAAWQREPDTALFLCYEDEQKRRLKTSLRAVDAHRYIMLVGPEGGFTPEEATLAVFAGAAPVTLGPRILRAETAALAALTAVQYEKGDL